jgi:error-prone DNA polymerase
MICEGDTVGVFQIESRAQMAMLPRLRPRNYYDLVIEVSIVRPGPIHGGMVHPYLKRRNGQEPVTYPHPSLEPVLKKTLGIPLFQEQVMQIAIVVADYTPGEADQLRRDMAAWRKSGRMERHRERLISRMMDKGIAREFAERVFEQICGFGEYGFPESHAASFSLIAYATAWLRRHYPAAFVCALLNAQPMGFYSVATLVEDSKRHGVEIRPVDVRHSERNCTLESQQSSGEGFAVRMGLRFVKGVHDADIERLTAAHPFATLREFVSRSGLGESALARLAEAGALEGFAEHRRDALWKVLGHERPDANRLQLEAHDPAAHFTPLDAMETVRWDYTFTSHSPRGHPLETMREELQKLRLPDAAQVRGMPDGRQVRYAGLVISRQRPGTAKGVVFMTLEDETGFVNIVLWEKVFTKFRILAKTEPFLGVTGKLQVESGVTHLVARTLWVPQVELRPQETKSRDFH